MKHVFIVGCRRSGTTWIATLLAQHPQVVAVQQSGFFLSLDHVTTWLVEQRKYGRAVLTADESAGSTDGLSRRSIESVFPLQRYHELVRPLAQNVYDHLGQSTSDATVVVDQQPEHVRMWEHIHAILPDAWFLHVARDPRSVYSSFVQAGKSWSNPDTFTGDPVDFGEEWCRDVSAARAIPQKTQNYVELRYESVRQDTVAELEKLYGALGLPCDTEQCERAVEACSMDKLRKAGRGPAQFFRRGETAGWRNELTKAQIETVEYVCADLMDELGYEREHKGEGKPALVAQRERKDERRSRMVDWLKEGDGPVKRALRGLGKKFPGLRRRVWRRLDS